MGDNGRKKDHASELGALFSHRKIADAQASYEDAKYVIFGVPFDHTSSFRRGSRLAPDSIRVAYDNLESFDFQYKVNYPDLPICDIGDLYVEEDPEEVVNDIERSVRHIADDGKVPIMLGGEHSLTTGLIRNFPECSMIIIDAHSDFRNEYMGSKYNHACITRRALEVLGEGRIFSVGTRSVSREEYEDPDFSKIRYFSANEVRKKGIQEVIEEIGKKVKGKIYFSIDMDGIDPSEAPGVGTPEPYGISSTEVRSLINHFAKRIIGFDIVEMTPVYDNGNTSMLAAKFVQDFIGSKERQA